MLGEKNMEDEVNPLLVGVFANHFPHLSGATPVFVNILTS